MKWPWSQYDLDLRADCIARGKKPPSRPEASYGIEPKGDYKAWGKNVQVKVHLNDCSSAEEYWDRVRFEAGKSLDKLIEDRL